MTESQVSVCGAEIASLLAQILQYYQQLVILQKDTGQICFKLMFKPSDP
jgi:hypothetical protein